jgi:catechol 2,3-dioxygenase-like lactoylglutathione lyase family enzyme
MSSTDIGADTSTTTPQPGTIDMKIEVITVPVSDIDRAKAFYQGLGWRVDADIARGDAFRVVQLTPPHSGASISLGKGLSAAFGVKEMEPGSQQRLELVVSDIVAAREDLISRGAEVGEVFHIGESGPAPGPDPERTSYNSYATFSDPDGNTWLLQEITTRLPGRVWED